MYSGNQSSEGNAHQNEISLQQLISKPIECNDTENKNVNYGGTISNNLNENIVSSQVMFC